MHKTLLAAVMVAALPLPAHADDTLSGVVKTVGELPEVGHTVNAFQANASLTPVTGVLVEIDPFRTNALNRQYVWVKIDPPGDTTVPVEAWLEVQKPKKKPEPQRASGSCCCSSGTTVVMVNNHAANVPAVRHYTGPVYFSADNRSVVNDNDTTIVNQGAPAPYCYGYCDHGMRIESYAFGAGGLRVGHYCPVSGRLIR